MVCAADDCGSRLLANETSSGILLRSRGKGVSNRSGQNYVQQTKNAAFSDATPFSSAELCYLQHRVGREDCWFLWTVSELRHIAWCLNTWLCSACDELNCHITQTFVTIIRSDVGLDSSVRIATRYGLDGPGIESRWRLEFPQPSRPTLGPTHTPIQWCW
jgi:hypothetical protein